MQNITHARPLPLYHRHMPAAKRTVAECGEIVRLRSCKSHEVPLAIPDVIADLCSSLLDVSITPAPGASRGSCGNEQQCFQTIRKANGIGVCKKHTTYLWICLREGFKHFIQKAASHQSFHVAADSFVSLLTVKWCLYTLD